MTVIYVSEQGATINRVGGRIIIRKKDSVLQDLPAAKIEQFVLLGNIHLTPATMSFCLQEGIDVAFLSSTGKYRGRLQPEFAKNATLRQQQLNKSLSMDFCRRIAVAIVNGKVCNMMSMLNKQRRFRENNGSALASLKNILSKTPTAPTLDSLYGYEGAASAAYFQSFRDSLKVDLNFRQRICHPPTDPVNSLLSLGYTLLFNDVYAAINIVGLDPYTSYFHRPRQGHAALTSDLMEEYRCVIVDPIVLTAVNKRMVVESDFRKEPEHGLRLSPIALKKFIALYAEAINQPVYYQQTNIQTTYRQIFELQVRQFARVLLGEDTVYRPFIA